MLVLSLAAPLLDTSIDQQQKSDIPAPQSEPFARVGVTLRRGDTVLSVLTRYGLPRLSAQTIVEKLKPLRVQRASCNFATLD